MGSVDASRGPGGIFRFSRRQLRHRIRRQRHERAVQRSLLAEFCHGQFGRQPGLAHGPVQARGRPFHEFSKRRSRFSPRGLGRPVFRAARQSHSAWRAGRSGPSGQRLPGQFFRPAGHELDHRRARSRSVSTNQRRASHPLVVERFRPTPALGSRRNRHDARTARTRAHHSAGGGRRLAGRHCRGGHQRADRLQLPVPLCHANRPGDRAAGGLTRLGATGHVRLDYQRLVLAAAAART